MSFARSMASPRSMAELSLQDNGWRPRPAPPASSTIEAAAAVKGGKEHVYVSQFITFREVSALNYLRDIVLLA